MFNIKCGNYDLLESRIISAPSMDDLIITLSEDPLMKLIIRIKKDEGAISSINLHGESVSELIVTFTNPTVVINFGTQDPILLGVLNKRHLYGVFRINIFGDYKSYQVLYSFFLGEEQL